MRKALRVLIPLAAAAVPLALAPGVASAADESFQATLDPLNGSAGSGMATISLDGNTADVQLSWSGLPAEFMGGPYPHVQHIHIGAQGTCPSPDADENGDGIVDTVEGQPFYGEIGTTLSTKGDTSPAAGTNIKIAPGGDSLDYSRTIELSDASASALREGTGVIVVHGLDPSTLSDEAAEASSNLVPSLPLAATSPALCGDLAAMPVGGVDTGTGSTAGLENPGVLVMGAGLLGAGLAGTALYTVRRRRAVEA